MAVPQSSYSPPKGVYHMARDMTKEESSGENIQIISPATWKFRGSELHDHSRGGNVTLAVRPHPTLPVFPVLPVARHLGLSTWPIFSTLLLSVSLPTISLLNSIYILLV